jgi:site-specific DNA-cytosine methylase
LGKKSSNTTGQNQSAMATLPKQISLFTEDELTFSQGAFLASPTHQQGSDLEKQMTATSGRKCLEQFGKFNRVGLWAKTFAALLIGTGGMVFDEVQSDLEAQGYEVTPFLLPACAVNAPHRRDRIWFVAYLHHNGHATAENGQGMGAGNDSDQTRKDKAEQLAGRAVSVNVATDPTQTISKCALYSRAGGSGITGVCGGYDSNSNSKGLQRRSLNGGTSSGRKERNKQPAGCIPSTWNEFPTQPPVCSGNDGLSAGLAGITFSKHRNESIKAYGNAVVPQVVHQIFKAIQQYEATTKP